MFYYRFMSSPIKQHHPSHLSTWFLPINQTEEEEEEHTTEEGKRNQYLKYVLTALVYSCTY